MLKNIALATAAVVMMGTAASAAPLFFDDFNADTQGAPVGSNDLAQWTVTSGSVDVIGSNPNPFFDFYPTNGNYLDMNGNNPARIQSDTIAGLVTGQRYRVSFQYGNNANSNGEEVLTFGIGTQLVNLNIPGAIGSLTNFFYDFVYDGTGEYLVFADTGINTPTDRGGPILDNVSLAATVPLPAGGLLLLGALAGFGALRRRKNA